MNIEILKKLILFKKIVPTITKDGFNPHFKSSYATLSDIQLAIKQPLERLGLSVIQSVERGCMRTIIFDNEGNFQDFSYPMPYAEDLTSQSLGSAITYARRYALASILDLIVCDNSDDDGTRATDRQEQKKFAKQNSGETVSWLTADEYEKTKAMDNPDTINAVLSMKIRKDGVKFGMSKPYRTGLQQRLLELVNEQIHLKS
jgi:ERF superfamily